MGTTTFYLRYNDFGAHLNRMKKKELEKLDKLSPYSQETDYCGWRTPLELHNGNIHVLIFWKGRLMKMEDAPTKLNKKYWNKYSGKTINIYEWTLLKKMILNEVKYLDKQFKKLIKKNPQKK